MRESSLSRRNAAKRAIAMPIAALFAVGLFAAADVAATAPAQAACTAISTKGGGTPSWTRSKSNDCAGNVQARVYRYISSYPTAYDGPQSRNSYRSATGGTAAGHSMRIQIAAGGTAWTHWASF